jgi:hypothetical protein
MNNLTKGFLLTGLILAGAITVQDRSALVASKHNKTASLVQFDITEEQQSIKGPIRKGGIKDLSSLKTWVLAHQALYPNFDIKSAKLEYAQADFWAFVQYRDWDDAVKWTHHLVLIQKGEVIYRDADGNMIRGKCGNGLTLITPPEDSDESFAILLGQPEPTDSFAIGVGAVLDSNNPAVSAILGIPPIVGPITIYEPIPCCGGFIVNEPIPTPEPSALEDMVFVLCLVVCYLWFRDRSKWTL